MPGIFFTFITMRKIRLTKISDDRFEGNHPNGVNQGYSITGSLLNYPIQVGKRVAVEHDGGRVMFVTSLVTEVIDWFEFKTQHSTYKFEVLDEEKPAEEGPIFPLTISLMGFEVIFQHFGCLNKIPGNDTAQTDKIVCEIRPVRPLSSTRIQAGTAIRDTRDSFDAKKGMSIALRNATINGPLSSRKYKAFRTKIYKIIQEA